MSTNYMTNPTQTEYSRIAPRITDSSSSTADPNSTGDHDSKGSGNGNDDGGPGGGGGGGGTKKKAKRRKVNHACLYCRRSHMTCDEGRPCQRCIKREIGHLCHDEPRQSSKSAEKAPTPSSSSMPPQSLPPQNVEMTRQMVGAHPYAATQAHATQPWPMAVAQGPFLPYQPETLGNEFSVLTDFLESLDERSFFNPPPTTVAPPLVSAPASHPFGNTPLGGQSSSTSMAMDHNPYMTKVEDNHMHQQMHLQQQQSMHQPSHQEQQQQQHTPEESIPVVLPSATKAEQFLLTAADQEPGSRDERLRRVIRSKYEAGLLKPYNYVKGYARLSRWMDRNVSQESKQQILQPLSVLRPKFRAIAQSLTDIDLVFIEEAFERLLLDYDRVFSVMGVPACLWRRTGEIYKGNREFAELVGVDGYMLREGRLCIYELMAEESAVNYWEKYGHVAFDSNQKAVLTTCVLRYKPSISPSSGPVTPAGPKKNKPLPPAQDLSKEEGFINCCFSFTIRRDAWGIPSMIVGNFIKC
ncbi:hypothetical protein JAAARDRAFT_59018 [Jaapia argillacea MUCL 33604]|uniref:Zn(2)-C6 fungal-type domain-containing protein n=1 Tax=Jaapia argillacea MUCL 33604 TaxID=933084 RepID=A0A067PPP6_9AGAM|nr:hypothetical protein JAAARDRAFT_59018 [Jaapia argillacea MUCL 33604]